MARTRTLTNLIADVRDRADVENSTHVTDTNVTRYINQSIARLHAMIVEADEDDLAEEVTAPIVSGTASTSLNAVDPPEFTALNPYKVLQVDFLETGTGRYWPVRKFGLKERAELESDETAYMFQTRYRLRGTNEILWAPAWDRAGTVRVTYIPSFADLVDGSDTFDFRDGWDEWVILDAAIRVGLKEEADVSALQTERALEESRILKQIANRDRGEPERIQDVWGVERW